LSVDHAGHAVVEAAGGIWMGFEASCSHEASASLFVASGPVLSKKEPVP